MKLISLHNWSKVCTYVAIIIQQLKYMEKQKNNYEWTGKSLKLQLLYATVPQEYKYCHLLNGGCFLVGTIPHYYLVQSLE